MTRLLRIRSISLAFLVLLWLTNVWRAATQSIVHDEALTWQFYLAGPSRMLFEYYDANNHFLAVLLMRIVTGVFGYSELSMRLVALAAAALYFHSVWRLSLRVFGERWTAVCAMALMVLNPLVLDFLVAARGYGLALALLVTGLWLVVETLEESKPHWKRVLLAGLCLGGSFAANLVFVLPALSLTAAFFWRARGKGQWVKWLPIGVAIAGFLLFLFSPVAKARSEDFYVGVASALESADNLATASLNHNDGLGGWNQDNAAQLAWRRTVACGLAPLLVLAGLWLGRGAKSGPALLGWLCAISIGAPALLLLAVHLTVGGLLPIDRTGLYFTALAGGLLAAVAASLLARGGAPRAAAAAIGVLGAVIAGQYVLQFQTASFLVWRYDADTRSLLEQAQQTVQAPAAAAANWEFEPAANFYRVTRGWQWLKPLTRDGPQAGGDFYLLLARESELVERLGPARVVRGPVSGAYLCMPRK
jgi:4-amino-4-deoxy-L-arabinose transferase-like glycosyltransferase